MSSNYTLGKGKLFFDQFAPNTKTKTGERAFGNAPEFSLTVESETLEHFSSMQGIRTKDDSVTLQTDRTGQFILDDIMLDNVALFFLGTKGTVTQTSGSVTDENIGAVKKDRYYQIGASSGNPTGVRNISAFVLKHTSGAPTYVAGTDYDVDLTLGRVYIKPTGMIADATVVKCDYTRPANTRNQVVVTSSDTISGALRFVAVNAKGENHDYYFPYVTISANGDFSLIGEEWQQMPFNVEVLKLDDNTAAMYIDDRPA